MGPNRWQAITESSFPWEREALEWLRAHLPDCEPWHAWSNFEFIDDEGKVNEVDALILAPSGLFLVEIKSRPGTVNGDAHTWTWTTDGRDYIYDNPLLLANRKAKRLKSLLQRQSSVTKARVRFPFIEPLIFLSATSLKCKLSGTACAGVHLRQAMGPAGATIPGILDALTNSTSFAPVPLAVDGQQARAVARGMAEAGIRPSNKHRQIGDYRLGKLLAESESFQEFEAEHVSIAQVRRRARIYNLASAASPEARQSLVRQAQREFQLLEGIDHPGILKVREYKDTDLGPALVFDHDPKAIRLDHLLRDQGVLLSVDQRLQLVRELAETLKYAHSRQLYHRALCPQSILVQPSEALSLSLRPRIMNWQAAARDAGSTGTTHRTSGTRHIDEYVEDPARVYLAPEGLRADLTFGPSLDVFSLGAIAYHVFAGQPPAADMLELSERLRAGQGLRLSDVSDGCGKRLQDLIQFSTSPDTAVRWGSMQEFLSELEGVEDELTTPDPETTVDPSIAKEGDRVEGGFTVLKRLGKGSSSDVLLVRRDGSDDAAVLKVANHISHNERLQAEGEILDRLRHQNIVEHRETLRTAGRTALLLRSAGEDTLAGLLRKEGRPSFDMLQRFGEELIQAVDHLEREGVTHRDIKPENIGIRRPDKGRVQLVLFDFSLSRTPAENLSAGTHPYLDPFLAIRRHWDLYAERFALAVTLYQMAAGIDAVPRWGDGQALPSLIDAEVTLDSGRFDPVTREAFSAFFAKALRREASERFDNADDMLRAWRALFATPVVEAAPAAGSFEAMARIATVATTTAELGYTLEAQDVLERMGIHNAGALLAVDRIKFRYLRGVGDRIRKEIRLKAKELRAPAARPDTRPPDLA